nr:hypothetical protein [Actinomyces gerencseriae]
MSDSRVGVRRGEADSDANAPTRGTGSVRRQAECLLSLIHI